MLSLVCELASDGAGTIEQGDRLSDVGFDSHAFAELATAVEDEWGVDLTRAALDGSNTVGELLDLVYDDRGSAAPIGLPPGTGRLQGVADAAGGWVVRRWLGLRVDGVEHVPRTGPAVLAMNHESALDIPTIVVASPRRITFMAKRELFSNALVSWSLRGLGGFVVDRDRFDLAAIGMAMAALRRGDLLGMYPEGTRAPGRLLPFLRGAAWMALGAGVPIVPCALVGTARASLARSPGRARVRVSFRAPILVERVEDATERRRRSQELTARLRAEIERGLAEAERTP